MNKILKKIKEEKMFYIPVYRQSDRCFLPVRFFPLIILVCLKLTKNQNQNPDHKQNKKTNLNVAGLLFEIYNLITIFY